MKAVLVFALFIAVAAADGAWRGYTHGHNGQPACTHAEETAGSTWRNNFDPTRYWLCESAGKAGVEVVCKSEHLYQPVKGGCVHYLEWVWTPFEDPHSMA